jgi:catechol 2,3-dioxygenase-like lactoylglutathione lyase family enzyme
MIPRLSAITFAVRHMQEAVEFYTKFGFEVIYGGHDSGFSSLRMGDAFVNLQLRPDYTPCAWGRIIFWVDDVDALYRSITARGLTPTTSPRDASWGERYFHINDPNGNELSFAKPLS